MQPIFLTLPFFSLHRSHFSSTNSSSGRRRARRKRSTIYACSLSFVSHAAGYCTQQSDARSNTPLIAAAAPCRVVLAACAASAGRQHRRHEQGGRQPERGAAGGPGCQQRRGARRGQRRQPRAAVTPCVVEEPRVRHDADKPATLSPFIAGGGRSGMDVSFVCKWTPSCAAAERRTY